jgi:hypothetical protein
MGTATDFRRPQRDRGFYRDSKRRHPQDALALPSISRWGQSYNYDKFKLTNERRLINVFYGPTFAH